jgi:hypothetical protein
MNASIAQLGQRSGISFAQTAQANLCGSRAAGSRLLLAEPLLILDPVPEICSEIFMPSKIFHRDSNVAR